MIEYVAIRQATDSERLRLTNGDLPLAPIHRSEFASHRTFLPVRCSASPTDSPFTIHHSPIKEQHIPDLFGFIKNAFGVGAKGNYLDIFLPGESDRFHHQFFADAFSGKGGIDFGVVDDQFVGARPGVGCPACFSAIFNSPEIAFLFIVYLFDLHSCCFSRSKIGKSL
jgi:hypothetical protein